VAKTKHAELITRKWYYSFPGRLRTPQTPYMATALYIAEPMRAIQLKDAKVKLSAVVDQAARGKPFIITRYGKPVAVVLGFAEWERLSRVPSFGRLLMSAPLKPGDLPASCQAPMRNVK
jgi:antitoxin Phd